MQRRLATLLALAGVARSAHAQSAAPDAPISAEAAAASAAPTAAASPTADRAAAGGDPDPDPYLARPPAQRRRDASLGALFAGPFASSRLFAMPLADVVGAYILSISGDASLLEKPSILTSAGVIALGFGDIAQLEYRHTEAVGVSGLDAPTPAVGVQVKLPLPARSGVPAISIAFRLGVPRTEEVGGRPIAETVTDLYVVGRLRFDRVPWLTLHGGTRISSAKAVASIDGAGSGDGSGAGSGDGASFERQRTLWLPTAGYELAMNPRAKIIGELALAPQFQWARDSTARPVIGRGMLGRLGMRWRLAPAVIVDGSLGYQLNDAAPTAGFDAVVSWDIRLGAEVFVPWGALACRAVGAFCD